MNEKLKLGWLIIAIFYISCSTNAKQRDSQTSSKDSQSAPLPAPAGWVLYPAPAADSPDLRCANASRREWNVSVKDENVEIRPFSERRVEESLPFEIQPEIVITNFYGARRVKRVNDGWLVGFNAGEWGGSLWWFSVDGLKRKQLAHERVVGFADSSPGSIGSGRPCSFDDG